MDIAGSHGFFQKKDGGRAYLGCFDCGNERESTCPKRSEKGYES